MKNMALKEIYSVEEAEKRFKSLPSDIQQLLYSTDMNKILVDIGSKYKLHIDQIGKLEEETGSVMLGFIEPADYSRMISEALQVDSAVAENIVKDVNEQLFIKIRESMKQLPPNEETAGSVVKSLPENSVADMIMQKKPRELSPSMETTPDAQVPKPAFSVADVMLSQKVTTLPVAVPPKLQPLTTGLPLPTTSTPITPVPASAPAKPPVQKAPTTPAVNTVPVAPPPTPTPNAQPPAQSKSYSTDPYHEPIE